MHFSPILRLSEPPAMAAVRQMLKTAMRANDLVQKTTIKSVMAAVKNADISKPGSMKTDLQLAGLVGSLIKKRLQSAEEYTKGKRQDLAENEHKEVAVLEELKKQLNVASPEELAESVKKFLSELTHDLNSKDAFKKVMAELPKDVEEAWRSPKSAVVSLIKSSLGQGQKREFSTFAGLRAHDNPLGLRRRSNPGARPAGSKLRIPNIRKVILVSSAKGGVGKSTVSTNLALSLNEQGFNTGLLDIDIFGPSIPKMLGLEDYGEPKLSRDGTKLLPLVSHGLKAMSMGFLVPRGKSVSWRGLLIQKALQQLLFEVEWGPTDYLVVDMPPGTGDIQLTVGQQLAVDGAVLVTTPQQVALEDARRGLDLFKLVNIPVLGLIENMAYFKCPKCGEETRIFGPPASLPGVLKLAEIPIEAQIASNADAGKFVVSPVYMALASKVAELAPLAV